MHKDERRAKIRNLILKFRRPLNFIKGAAIEDLGEDDCRYITSSGYCRKARKERSSYCKEHHNIVYSESAQRNPIRVVHEKPLKNFVYQE